ncbi:DNA polymerase III subunit epsilon [Microvirga tunisiensis]|uniref:DNA polymerase III subunit epsilon n=2 Tax=Pannonibacter tanglangensis TaxID=2750084 RepID=A0ABW9ZL07_9HYPH|nr:MULTISPECIES: DNA polymerase III subunit epsilon [unclassified Pannonibacter]NBN65599.1 DNA polymerase III subunit epsilon [Pannonibacter sp. XCT-34]NBN80174.1 DNA polymerase III subunit epsilon [Pannonibacter sp. XCT-53]
MREIAFDTETTGLDPRNGDRLVEIGGVEMLNHVPTGRTFHVYINPERDVPEGAFAVHGLSTEFLADKPKFAEVVDDFLAFVGEATLVIHNASFDMGFINMELGRVGRPPIPRTQVLDTLELARRKHPMGPNSLDALCSRYGIDNSRRTKHGALLDSELLAEVYLELIGGRQTALGFDMDSGAASGRSGGADEGLAATAPARQRPQPLAPLLTSADLERHAAFIKGMGDGALWKKYAASET